MKKDIKLELFEKSEFLGTECDFYKDEDNNIYMTREQIGIALQYANPQKAMDNLHGRNKDRLNKFSVTLEVRATDGKAYNTHLYMERGIYDVTRFSKQPVADEFYDWVYDKMILIRKAGAVIDDKDLFIKTYCGGLDESTKAVVKSFMTKVEEQQAKIDVMQPGAEHWEAFGDAKGNITLSKVAKSLNIKGIGRNKLFDILRNNKVLRTNNEPYQRYVDSGYFEVVVGNKNGFKFTQTLATDKGMGYISDKMKEWGYAK